MADGTNGGSNSAIVAVLVLAVIALAAWFAYKQGYLTGKNSPSPSSGININIQGSSPTPTSRY